MAQTFAVNSNNDLFVDNNGNLVLANDLDALIYACSSAAKTQLGEMIFFTTTGVPNFQTIWNGSPNIPQFEAALRTVLLNVKGVTEVVSLTTSFADNAISYRATIKTIYGTGTINGGL